MKHIKTIMILSAGAFASIALGGGSQGGGTPPALQDTLEMLMSNPALGSGLFDNGAGDIGLLSRVKLQPQMLAGSGMSGGTPPAIRMMGGSSTRTPPVLASGSVGMSNPPALTLSEDDVAILRDRNKPIDAVSSDSQNLSFDIEAGDTIDSVVLKDRRLKMRESIKSN